MGSETTPGLVCLQGGAEFGAACRDMDRAVLAAAPPGPVVVLAGAASPGRDHATASRNAARYHAGLGADDVRIAPHPLEDPDGATAVLADAALVVLPGGSPARLHAGLAGGVGAALRARHAAGAAVSGASAGAMVLCEHTWLPDRGGAVVAGLGLAPGVALVHHRGEDRRVPAVPDDAPRWGLPECGGVLLHAGTVTAAGAGEPVLFVGRRRVVLARRATDLTGLLSDA
ncbi:MAG: hypothetical protein ACLGIR_00190 [Actinomycetes bacterium]